MGDFQYYEKDGQQFDRVTTILDYFKPPYLVDWILRVGKREANKISRDALRIGSYVDEFVDNNLSSHLPSLTAGAEGDRTEGSHTATNTTNTTNAESASGGDKKSGVVKRLQPQVDMAVRAWQAFKEENPNLVRRIVCCQARIFHHDLGVAGTADIVGTDFVIDLKCAKRISITYWLQLAIYNRGLDKKRLGVLRLDKELGTYELVWCPFDNHYLEQVYISLLTVYRFFTYKESEV